MHNAVGRHLRMRRSQSMDWYLLQPTEMLLQAYSHSPSASCCRPCTDDTGRCTVSYASP